MQNCRKFSYHADQAPTVCAPLLTALCLALLQSLIRLTPVAFSPRTKRARLWSWLSTSILYCRDLEYKEFGVHLPQRLQGVVLSLKDVSFSHIIWLKGRGKPWNILDCLIDSLRIDIRIRRNTSTEGNLFLEVSLKCKPVKWTRDFLLPTWSDCTNHLLACRAGGFVQRTCTVILPSQSVIVFANLPFLTGTSYIHRFKSFFVLNMFEFQLQLSPYCRGLESSRRRQEKW
jgi:hypothetical protein